jgi:hypothetical protein
MLYETQLGLLGGNTAILLLLMIAGRLVTILIGYMMDNAHYLKSHHSAFLDGVMRLSGFEAIQRNHYLDRFYQHRRLTLQFGWFGALCWSLWLCNVLALLLIMPAKGPMGVAWLTLGVLIMPFSVRMVVRHYRLAKLRKG